MFSSRFDSILFVDGNTGLAVLRRSSRQPLRWMSSSRTLPVWPRIYRWPGGSVAFVHARRGFDAVLPAGAGNSAVVVDLPRYGPMLSSSCSESRSDCWSQDGARKPLVSAHDQIMGTHTHRNGHRPRLLATQAGIWISRRRPSRPAPALIRSARRSRRLCCGCDGQRQHARCSASGRRGSGTRCRVTREADQHPS